MCPRPCVVHRHIPLVTCSCIMNPEASFSRFLKANGIPVADYSPSDSDAAFADSIVQAVFVNCGLEEDLYEFILSLSVQVTQCKQLGSLEAVAVCMARFAGAVERLETYELTLFRKWLGSGEEADFPFYLKVTGT